MANAPNIDSIKATVKSTGWMVFLGDYGDARHQLGTGDHTHRSTHVGKYGYPTQGVVHAIDTGMTNVNLDLVETFIRRSWRRGELTGIKYFNVLNRHWNTQTWENYNAAKAGALQARYSSDHHLHLSMENGSIDGDILDRFKTWLENGQSFNPPPEEDDNMAGQFLGPISIPADAHWSGPINPVLVGAANPRPAWLNVVNDTHDTDYKLRIFYTTGNGSWGPVNFLADGRGAAYVGDGVWQFKNGIRASFPLKQGAVCLTISRHDGYKGPLAVGIEYGEIQKGRGK